MDVKYLGSVNLLFGYFIFFRYVRSFVMCLRISPPFGIISGPDVMKLTLYVHLSEELGMFLTV
jgi:hypothetical protein